MSKTNQWESDLLNLLFLNTDVTLVGDAAGLQNSAAAGSLYVSLHTGDPGEAGTQLTSESAYGSYARVAVARSGVGWTVSGSAPTQVVNAAAITFPACTSLTSLVTHFGVGTDATGAGKLLYKGTLTPSITITAGITPQIPALGLTVTED